MKAYWDINHYSIWYWTKSHKWEIIDKVEAEARLYKEVKARWDLIKNDKLTVNQKVAITSYLYNTWNTSILKRVKRNDLKSVKYVMNLTVYAWGKRLKGLVTRRSAEVELMRL